MSKLSTPVDAALFDFIRGETIQEDDLLRDLRQAALAAGLPEIHIAPEQAAFLQILLAAARAVRVVEIGTLGGYSAISMARGLAADGHVITHELEPKHAAFAEEWIAKSDQKDRIEVRVGDAHETLAQHADGTADAIFIDAEKEGYVDYLVQSLRILRPGGILLADNVLDGGEINDPNANSPRVRGLRDFLKRVRTTKHLQRIIVPVGDGCLVAVKSWPPM
ncbi:MAG: O-methyltransferase [bacterium]|nr:O-methyltransferase [bacterium]